METGEIVPAERLGEVEWSKARRTICDVDLNDSGLGENAPGHLWNRRKYQLNLLVERLNTIHDPFQKVRLAREFTQPDKPFSSFVSAYLRQRFPEL